MPSEFHFLDPEWFLALLPLAAILWGVGRRGSGAGAWQRVVDPDLLPHLLVHTGAKARWLPLALLAAGWLTAVLALANPTFERLPVPAFRGELARVILLDLSRSMETTDLKPSRLARARYKVADILERSRDGQAGLIAFAGEAFVVSPLTDDADTILAMLDAVVPEIMPVQGSRPDLAIAKAVELLAQAGSARGEVLLVGDDAGGPEALTEAKALHAAGHRLSVIGVGTEDGAPVPGVLDNDEHPVLARLDVGSMKALAGAGGGAFARLSADGTDLDRTLRESAGLTDQALSDDEARTEVWRELGPWLLLAVLPLGALSFRKGWMLALSLSISGALMAPEPAMAFSWDDLWQRPDQQAAAALDRGEHERALDLAVQPGQRGTASYRLGDFEAAAAAFADVDQADGHYNLGNALAKSGQLQEAIAAYDRALTKAPEMQDAAYNKALIEELLKQEQEQQQSQGEGEEGQQDAGSEERDETGQEQQEGEQRQESGEGEDQADTQGSDQPGEAAQTPQDQTSSNGSDSDPGDEGEPAEAEDREKTEQAAADYRDEAAEHSHEQATEESASPRDEPSTEEREAQQAANQWLRRIPDDPAGLLRRKFLYQYRSRAAEEGTVTSGKPW